MACSSSLLSPSSSILRPSSFRLLESDEDSFSEPKPDESKTRRSMARWATSLGVGRTFCVSLLLFVLFVSLALHFSLGPGSVSPEWIARRKLDAALKVSSAMNGSYFNPSANFSFVHISKGAGSTFIRLLKSAPLDVCPRSEAGREHSAWYQHQVACKDANYHMVSLRSPRHHVWSLFTQCKYGPWGKRVTNGTNFPNSGNEVECEECDETDFDRWLESFLPMGPDKERYYNCYHPANYQSRALTSHHVNPHGVDNHQHRPNLTLAEETYRDFDFVASADFVHESRCLLYYRLGPDAPANTVSYLNTACNCNNQSGVDDVHVSHHALGHRATLRDLPPRTLSKIENLTQIDTEIYITALKDFIARIAWLESKSALGRRVLCDSILEKWEPELAYLNLSVTELYNGVRKELQRL
mmetsp:Transcript_29582/g.62843  ORF Transcript_29582/g.62843 Transcript_29582/m.62843 type:complete len:413 (-) Transcript_29582:1406-2644(-)